MVLQTCVWHLKLMFGGLIEKCRTPLTASESHLPSPLIRPCPVVDCINLICKVCSHINLMTSCWIQQSAVIVPSNRAGSVFAVPSFWVVETARLWHFSPNLTTEVQNFCLKLKFIDYYTTNKLSWIRQWEASRRFDSTLAASDYWSTKSSDVIVVYFE